MLMPRHGAQGKAEAAGSEGNHYHARHGGVISQGHRCRCDRHDQNHRCLGHRNSTRRTSAPDLTYAVEASNDLVTWSTTNVTLGLASTDGVTDTWQATYPQALGANVFFRLKVTRL
jgi:hypothetical protein